MDKLHLVLKNRSEPFVSLNKPANKNILKYLTNADLKIYDYYFGLPHYFEYDRTN